MANIALRIYLKFRNPKVFLIVLATFILASALCHIVLHYDNDWGSTNLTLSIEASVAGAVLMMVAERSSRVQDEMARVQQEQLAALIQMGIAERQILSDHIDLLKQIKANDEKLMVALIKPSVP